MSDPTLVKAKWQTGGTDDEGKPIYVHAEASFDFRETVAEAVEAFGEDAVHSNYLSAVKIQFQSAIRQHGLAGVAPEDIAAKLTDWVPGQKIRATVDPAALMRQRYAAATTDEDREAILRDIMGEEEV